MSSSMIGLARSWISPESVRFRKEEEGGMLTAAWGDRRGPVLVRRLFPLSDPNGSIWVGDRDGSEWGVLPTLEGLDPYSLDALSDELRLNPFLPRIERIVSIQRRFGEYSWTVETDSGEFRFLTGPLYESVTALASGERVVLDRNEQRYLLRDDSRIDSGSRKKLAKWL